MELTGSSLMAYYGVTGSEEINISTTLNDPIFGQAPINMYQTADSKHKTPPDMKEEDFHNSRQELELTELRNADFPEDVLYDLSESTNFTICSSFHVLNPSTPPLGLIIEDELELHQDRLFIKEEPLDLESDSCGYPSSDVSSPIRSDSGYSDFSHSINCESETYMSELWPVDNTVSIDSSSNDAYLYHHAKTEDVFNIPQMSNIPTVCSESDSDSGDSIEEKPARKKPGRKKGQVSKVLHLWEFIRDLLKDPNYSGRIIKWEDKSSGIFRIVKSSEVAVLWGQKKKNKRKMTYEKMSRSLRYSRKEGYFGAVPKEKRYPKKLCFKFGPKSKGWE